MFDYKKLDQYKVALDDGFEYDKTDNNSETYIYKTKDGYYNFIFEYPKGKEVEIEAKKWETFKKKVEEFFEGGENGINKSKSFR